MPIYEYYCPDNNTIYQFYAKTLAQGNTVPRCPGHPAYRMKKIVSSFAVTKGGKADPPSPGYGAASEDSPSADSGSAGGNDDPRLEAAMNAMENDFSGVDENDPRAMGRMMRRMAELTGEKIDGEMEEVVRKLEEGTDPESLEEQLGGEGPGGDDPSGEGPGEDPSSPRLRPGKPGRRRSQGGPASFPRPPPRAAARSPALRL